MARSRAINTKLERAKHYYHVHDISYSRHSLHSKQTKNSFEIVSKPFFGLFIDDIHKFFCAIGSRIETPAPHTPMSASSLCAAIRRNDCTALICCSSLTHLHTPCTPSLTEPCRPLTARPCTPPRLQGERRAQTTWTQKYFHSSQFKLRKKGIDLLKQWLRGKISALGCYSREFKN